MDQVLVVEDTESLRQILATVLNCEGYNVVEAASGEDALEHLKSTEFSLILSDLKLPGINGLDFIKNSKNLGCKSPIIVMTAYGNIDIAVEAMKIGATDFITKPFDPETLCRLIGEVIKHRRIITRNFVSARRNNRRLITQSPAMEEVLTQCKKVAALSSTVMIVGESGTGKELVAHYIHEHSPRIDETFVAVNCASMPGELLESEFFGHEAGSFTGATEKRVGLFEVANGGTLFLDEIGTMPPELQVKLLRTLQESEIKPIGSTKIKKIDTRVISATNCNIEEEIEKGNFREDLYYRLGVIIIEVPPLRNRKEDIELLTNYFIKRFSLEAEKDPPILTPEGLKKLMTYHWPGNVRELENVVERALIFSNDPRLAPEHFELGQKVKNPDGSSITKSLAEIASAAQRLAEMEAITNALIESGGNKSKAARMLEVSYKTLLNKVKEYDL